MAGLERSRGLGTRLASILPTEEEVGKEPPAGIRSIIPKEGSSDPAPGGSERHLRDDQLAFMGLAVLQRTLSLDLCAYVSRRKGKGLQLQMRALPGLARDPDEALTLSGALEELFESAHPNGATVDVGGVPCIAVGSSEHGWKALHVLGRLSSPLDAGEKEVAERACAILASSLHRRH